MSEWEYYDAMWHSSRKRLYLFVAVLLGFALTLILVTSK